MTVEPSVVNIGGEVVLEFSGLLLDHRGGYFYLVDSDRKRVAGLWSDQNEAHQPGHTTDMENFEMLAYGVSGPGPDRLILPPDVGPGAYDLCTANSVPEVCTKIEIR